MTLVALDPKTSGSNPFGLTNYDNLKADVDYLIANWQDAPFAEVIFSGSASLAAATWTTVTFSGVGGGANQTGMWSAGDPTKVVLNKAGIWLLLGVCIWPTSPGDVALGAQILVNGTFSDSLIGRGAVGIGGISAPPAIRMHLSNGTDYVQLRAYQSGSGGNLGAGTELLAFFAGAPQ